MKKLYCFAGIELEIEIPDALMYENERDLEPFRVDSVSHPHRYTFTLKDELSEPQGTCIVTQGGLRVYEDNDLSVRYIGSVQQSWDGAYLRVSHKGLEHRAEVKRSSYTDRIGVQTVLNSLAAEHLAAQHHAVIFHSSYIDIGGRGVLFTAPSGTGKSTQAQLWNSHRGAEILNGDRAAIRPTDSGVEVCGVPFSGSSQICHNRTLPLAAVVYLEQAPQNVIRRLSGSEAFRCIWEGCCVNTWDRDDVSVVSGIIQTLLMTVPVYKLSCLPDASAVAALEGVLNP